MKSATPLISIILPVYNGQRFLKDAIKSCLNQTYQTFELIIVDDCSTDNSLKIAQKYKQKDSRVIVISNINNKMLPASLNIGHKFSKGDYITWTSDDNILKPNFLMSLYESMILQGCDVVYSNYDIINSDGSLKRKYIPEPLQYLIFGNVIGASFLYKRLVFEELNGYREDLFLVEDYHFFLRATMKFKFYHLQKSIYQYRIHSESLSGSINRNKKNKIEFQLVLSRMYEDVGREFNMNKKTISLLLELYLRQPISIIEYLKHHKIHEKDICNYERSIRINNKLDSIKLSSRIRENWQRNKKEHTLKTLFYVLMKQKNILLGLNENKNATVKLIFDCIF